ncbi:MAG: electron transfer flavoprotein subunit beta/FixA family protein [Bacteroidales bacterium]|jgi:electron transfer flavoprotein beta subunit|nr:electron transfer flavoprotein subunit beta/FixA family protein [Bacteroidales bacterium]
MGLKILVLAKQVPDTRNVGQDAMKPDGTVNRAALPAIFNPEDLNALEQALRLKDTFPGTTVHIVTMGPPRAAEIIREAMFRGADGGYLVTDRAFAGADTLATSYTLSLAVKKLAPFDLILAGRQAIDGDTAQVGPQVADKVAVPQITYAEEIQSVKDGKIRVKRRLERGIEIVESPLPCVVTVHSSAAECRFRNSKLTMKNKHAKTLSELQETESSYVNLYKTSPWLTITEWSANDLNPDFNCLGLTGSPTKVKTIENVVLTAKESVQLTPSDSDMDNLMKELIANHTIG